MGLATFWASFLQAHLVTLHPTPLLAISLFRALNEIHARFQNGLFTSIAAQTNLPQIFIATRTVDTGRGIYLAHLSDMTNDILSVR
jgi:hypothetical protein